MNRQITSMSITPVSFKRMKNKLANSLFLVSATTVSIIGLCLSTVTQASAAAIFSFSFGGLGSGNGQLSIPTDMAVDNDGNIYVADLNNNRIQKFNSSGKYVSAQYFGVNRSTMVWVQ